MATVKDTVNLIFKGVDQTTPTLGAITGGLRALDDVAQSVATPFSKIFDTVTKADAALAALAGATVTAAIIQAGKLGDSFAEISTLIDASDSDLAAFRQQILDYGRTSTASYDSVNTAVYTAISAGTDYRQSLDMVNQSERLAVAGRGDLDATTKLLVSTLNAYGAGTAHAQKYSDVFFQAVRDGQTTLPELSDTLSQVVGIAAAGGVDIETLGAAIATLTANGLQTDQAMTALKGAITSIIKPGADATQLAHDLGIEFDAQALKSKGLASIMGDVARATSGNTAEVARLFPNVRALNGVLVMTSDDGLKRLNTEMGKMQDATGSTAAAFQKMADSFSLVNQNVLNNLQATLAQLGGPLLDQYGDVADAVSAVFAAIGDGVDAGSMDPLFAAINGWGQELEQWLRDVAAALPTALQGVDLSGFIQALKDLGDEFGLVFDGIDLATPQGLQQIIQTVVDGLTVLTGMTRGIVQEFGPIAQQIGLILGQLSTMGGDTAALIGRLSAVGKLVKKFGVLFGGAMSALSYDPQVVDEFADLDGAFSATGASAAAAAPKIADLTSRIEAIGKTAGQADVAGLAQALGQVGVAAAGASVDDLTRQLDALDATSSSAGTSISGAGTALDATGQKALAAARQIQGATADTDTFRVKMAQLDADLAGKSLQAHVDLQVAQFDAEARQIEATFDSLTQTITSGGQTITSLFSQLGAAGGPSYSPWGGQATALTSAIQQQQAQRQQAIQLQNQLTQAQIDALTARTQALQQGQALITVDMSGAAPSLQRVMWEMLEAIQIEANGQAADFLLGVP